MSDKPLARKQPNLDPDHLERVKSQQAHAKIDIDEAAAELGEAGADLTQAHARVRIEQVRVERARQRLVDAHAHARKLLKDFATELTEIEAQDRKAEQ
ncbi:hypothetical protein SEA_BANTAM_79 [Gordonia phage Bantam]|uniref:Uncharacterized protein n=1 Tax=Gordonia phage Bantam TaxID=1887641 RepID=A0A1B3AYD8_9CAUD|nr:hypothetical protein BIZ77_gp100 [Gordonia phage Bantam]AOE43768.1 hypothetical protein SEA_BANTAM_79 [Gordonia phage Bantam]